jgi:tetratricopeptide (TPR) repeat protein
VSQPAALDHSPLVAIAMPRFHCSVILTALIWISLHARLPAAEAARNGLDQRLLADARDGVLHEHDFVSACLIAGGVTEEHELAGQRAAVSAAIARAYQRTPEAASVEGRAAAVLEQLHDKVLTGRYDKHATDLPQTLTTGNYNCLSALVMYVELCNRADVPLEIWSQPGHVYCVLADRNLRVEPGSGQWPAAPQDIHHDLPARRITPVQLVGKFYYNRGVELLEQRAFEPGVEALRIACQLDPHDADARTNLLAGLNNWALALVAQDQPAAAAALIARGLAIDPAFAPLVANERYVAELARVRAHSP